MALAAPRAVLGQQPGRRYRVAIGSTHGGELLDRLRGVIGDRLASHGFVEGKNLELRTAIGGGSGDHYAREAARAMLGGKPDAVLIFGTNLSRALQQETSTVPVVFTQVSDPVAAGLVKDLARPGANVTGVSTRHAELAVKRLQLLRELLPKAKRFALFGYFWQADLQASAPLMRKAAADIGFELVEVDGMSGSWEVPLAKAADDGASAVISWHSLIGTGQRFTGEALAAFTTKRRLVFLTSDGDDAALGSLASYGTDSALFARQGADQVARVLKGANPGTIPVDQVSRFELVVNMKTARAIGLAVPQSVLVRADRVIE